MIWRCFINAPLSKRGGILASGPSAVPEKLSGLESISKVIVVWYQRNVLTRRIFGLHRPPTQFPPDSMLQDRKTAAAAAQHRHPHRDVRIESCSAHGSAFFFRADLKLNSVD